MIAFRDALGVETCLDIIENDAWNDLHPSTLDLLINVVENADFCDYVLQSGALARMINLLDTIESEYHLEKAIGVLSKMSQTEKGRKVRKDVIFKTINFSFFVANVHHKIVNEFNKYTNNKFSQALHKIGMVPRFCAFLNTQNEKKVEYSCFGIANMAQHIPALEDIIEENPIPLLLGKNYFK